VSRREREREREHERHHKPRIILEGELFVTDRGYVVIEEPLRRCRPLLIHAEEAVLVRFKPDEHVCPPCAPIVPDELEWEAFEREPLGELFLKIRWRVSCARTIEWYVFEVD
jgi:hypothetical protein